MSPSPDVWRVDGEPIDPPSSPPRASDVLAALREEYACAATGEQKTQIAEMGRALRVVADVLGEPIEILPAAPERRS